MRAVEQSFSHWASQLSHKRPRLSVIRVCYKPSANDYLKIPIFRIDVDSATKTERDVAFQYLWFLRWGMGYRGPNRNCEVVVDKQGIPLTGWLVSPEGESNFQRRARRSTILRALSSGYHLYHKASASRYRHGQKFLPAHLKNDMWFSVATSEESWESRLSYFASRDGDSLCAALIHRMTIDSSRTNKFPVQLLLATATVARTRGPSHLQQKIIDDCVDAISTQPLLCWKELLATSQSISAMSFGERQGDGPGSCTVVAPGGRSLWQRIVSSSMTSSLPGQIVLLMRNPKDVASVDTLLVDTSIRLEVLLPLLEQEVHYPGAQRVLCEILLLVNFLWRFQACEEATLTQLRSVAKVVSEACGRCIATANSSREERRNSVGNPREVASVTDKVETRCQVSETSCLALSGALLDISLPSTSMLPMNARNYDVVAESQTLGVDFPVLYHRRRCEFLIGDAPDSELCNYTLALLAASVSLLMKRRNEPEALQLGSQLERLLKTSLWEHYSRFGFFCQFSKVADDFFFDVCSLNVPSAVTCAVAPRNLSDTVKILSIDFGEDTKLSPLARALSSLFYTSVGAAFADIFRPIRLPLIKGPVPSRPVAPPSGILVALDVVLPWVDQNHHAALRDAFQNISIAMPEADMLYDTLQLIASAKCANGVVAKALRASICQSIGFIVRKERVAVVITSADDVLECFQREILASRGRLKKRM